MSARDALRELARLGLTARMQGTGVVVEQSPAAGIAARARRAPAPSSSIAASAAAAAGAIGEQR